MTSKECKHTLSIPTEIDVLHVPNFLPSFLSLPTFETRPLFTVTSHPIHFIYRALTNMSAEPSEPVIIRKRSRPAARIRNRSQEPELDITRPTSEEPEAEAGSEEDTNLPCVHSCINL